MEEGSFGQRKVERALKKSLKKEKVKDNVVVDDNIGQESTETADNVRKINVHYLDMIAFMCYRINIH
ncbi:conserved hypothetical protein [Ricinus communis]|uniref:Uncharacterized protein n=1 Tax=Ricinus communis TaxID=3988 RepID=B9SAH2_RICCO|nr:conserved hypothetical protein [Ricinus communis]